MLSNQKIKALPQADLCRNFTIREKVKWPHITNRDKNMPMCMYGMLILHL